MGWHLPYSRGLSGGRERLWTLLPTVLGFAALVLACASGCGRTVLVSESSPVRVGPGVRGRVYALVGGEWRLSANAVELREGWYLVPPSFVEEEE